MKKFYAVIGNPPFQEETEGTSDNPIYNTFMDESYEVGEKVELITPARFLFNAGKTPKPWNKKMLNDNHLKVMLYEPDAKKVFPETGFKGGVAITYRDVTQEFGAIGTFTSFPELNAILKKVNVSEKQSLSSIVYSPESYKFTQSMHHSYPEAIELMSEGHSRDITSNIFEKLPMVFEDQKPKNEDEYIRIFGKTGSTRCYKWIKRKYIDKHDNLDKFKLFFPKSSGAGKFGEAIANSEIGLPSVGHTQTFISMGNFDTQYEVEMLDIYLRTKFVRALLGVLKVTQDNKKGVWRFVPLQDFTPSSDIDWTKSIPEIDQQLYEKYNLSDEEVAFIESHVKEMK